EFPRHAHQAWSLKASVDCPYSCSKRLLPPYGNCERYLLYNRDTICTSATPRGSKRSGDKRAVINVLLAGGRASGAWQMLTLACPTGPAVGLLGACRIARSVRLQAPCNAS